MNLIRKSTSRFDTIHGKFFAKEEIFSQNNVSWHKMENQLMKDWLEKVSEMSKIRCETD